MYASALAKLRSKLDQQGIVVTQRELAVQLGVTETTIQNWEYGKVGAIQFQRVIRLCELLECEIEDLITPLPGDEPLDYFDISDKPDWKTNIKELRERKRLTQRVLAYRLGITDMTLKSWENHHKCAELIARIIKLCRILRCHVQDLVEVNPTMTIKK
ncbi:helix-turn-helix domain-containing protein [Alkalinema pantanalense CENA528]|uniref:helix-turn-helix domain-containing protein n=1 Tax=Alkalinema pantanalense TaxID=1620705 RepID=UPI003D6F8D9A